jgi:DNA-binding winged helix-turn-helix (wHTH) protein
MSSSTIHFYEFESFRIDLVRHRLLRDNEVVPLTEKVFATLLALVEHSGQVVSKDRLMELIWPDSFVEEGNLSFNVCVLRRALGERPHEHRYIMTVPGEGYRFVASVKPIESGDTVPDTALLREEPAPPGGALRLNSSFYITRPTDERFREAIKRQDGIILVKGARQVGKSSLLARGFHQAREAGAKVVWTDFQSLNAAYLESAEKLLLMLAELVADQLDLDVSPDQVWNPRIGPSSNLELYMRREALSNVSAPIVWSLDEVDRLFTCDFGSEVFGLFRSWHNLRAIEPAWQRLTLVMAYATEARLFITDPNQSPFNVGTHFRLGDFTLEQVAVLNRCYNSPLRDGEAVARYFHLVGGHPYLVERGLYEMAGGLEWTALEAQADDDEGLFGNHLRHLLDSLRWDAALCEVVSGLLRGEPCATADSFYRLRSAGVVVGNSAREAKLRCQLYVNYLSRHLL